MNALVALLGHELQHAVEVASAPDVMTPAQLATLYRRIGVPMGPGRYDSDAARTTGYRCRRSCVAVKAKAGSPATRRDATRH